MATFAGQAPKAGQGIAYWLDVSLDKFATIAYRWGTAGGKLDGVNDYDERIASLGQIKKEFSPEHVAKASTIDVKLSNIDRGVDWMVDTATSYQVFYARARLYVGLFDFSPSQPPANLTSKQLGEFVIAYFPERDDSTVSFTLSDDLLGILNQPVSTPTLDDWATVGGAGNCPMWAGSDPANFTYSMNPYEMLPLVFGGDWAPARVAGKSSNSVMRGLVVCVTAETGLAAAAWTTASQQLVAYITPGARYGANQNPLSGTSIVIPQTWTTNFSSAASTYTLWTPKVSTVLTKDGKTYLVLWIQVDKTNLYGWFKVNFAPTAAAPGSSSGQMAASAQQEEEDLFDGIGKWYVRDQANVSQGIKLSGITQYAAQTHAADVIQDLITYYSKDGGAGYVDAASFTRARQQLPWAQASGIIQPGLDLDPDQKRSGIAAPSRTTLREHVTGICQSADLDVFVTWSGTVAISSLWFDYNSSLTSTLFNLAEERSGTQIDATPSNGDRWAPYNRIVLAGMKPNYFTGEQIVSPGPYDNPDTNAADWKQKLEVTWQLGWTPVALQQGNPWYMRHAEQKVRPLFRQLTDIEAIANLDLGSVFFANWTRNFGASHPYTNTVFQVESIALNPSDDGVEIRAIWRDELQTDQPYLLDNETLLTRATGSAGRTATVTDGSGVVQFSSGSVIADGVAVNDHLILKDTGEGPSSFKRNKAVKITVVTDATHITVADPLDALNFGTGGPGVAVSSWEIRKSERTYPSFATDPANYPDDSKMYGKIADTTNGGVFSDATAANKL